MADQVPDSASSRKTVRRRWWQFSLTNLLLVVVMVCVTAGYYGSRQELEEARRKLQSQALELEELRQQIGVISVTDEFKLHLRDRRSPFDSDPFHWRWRVHLPTLPPNSRWSLKHELRDDKEVGFRKSVGGVGFKADGQFDLDVIVVRDFDGKPWLLLNILGVKKKWESTVPLRDQQFQSVRRLVNQGNAKVAGRQLVVAPADQRLELLGITSGDKPKEQTGLVIYLERIDEKIPSKR